MTHSSYDWQHLRVDELLDISCFCCCFVCSATGSSDECCIHVGRAATVGERELANKSNTLLHCSFAAAFCASGLKNQFMVAVEDRSLTSVCR